MGFKHWHNKNSQRVNREQWMRLFEENVVELDAKHSGKIEWDSATHFHNQGLSAKDAATTYVKNREETKP